MRVLAIDPASNKCGIAVFDDNALEKTLTLVSTAKTPLTRRLDIAIQLAPLIATADVIVSEEPFLQGKNNNGMQRLLGMIEKISGGSVVFFHPMSIKKALGSGTLDKLAVALAAGERLVTDGEKEMLAQVIDREAWDESDAIAIGLTYITQGATK